MIEVKNFLGVLNTDDKEQNIAPSEHIQALNLRFYGGKNGLTAFNVEGNTQIPNSLPHRAYFSSTHEFEHLKNYTFNTF